MSSIDWIIYLANANAYIYLANAKMCLSERSAIPKNNLGNTAVCNISHFYMWKVCQFWLCHIMFVYL